MLPMYLFFKVRLQLLYLSLQVVTSSPLGLQLMLHHLQPHRCEVDRQVLTACTGVDCKHCPHLGFSFDKLGVFRQVSTTCTGVDCKHHPYLGFVWPEPSLQKSVTISLFHSFHTPDWQCMPLNRQAERQTCKTHTRTHACMHVHTHSHSHTHTTTTTTSYNNNNNKHPKT